MKINFVTEEKPGWVLRWIAETYCKYFPDSVVNTKPDNTADINFYINYDLFKTKSDSIDVGYFTHREEVYEDSDYEGMSEAEVKFSKETALKRQKHFDEVAKEVDWCIAMNKGLLKVLPENKTTVNLIPPDKQFMKGDVVIGWAGKFSKTGRKRLHWLEELNNIEGVTVKATNGNYDWKELPEFYKSIDYLLVFSKNEGGPLPLVEALAMGVPVISNDVGFASEYTTLCFNTKDDLISLINGLIIKRNAWQESVDDLKKVFKNLIEER